MTQLALYECSYLAQSNKVGKLKVDANGYHEIVLGAFDCANKHGKMYAFTSQLKRQFEPGGIMYRQMSENFLYGEVGHPVRTPGMTAMDFFQRVQIVAELSTSHHIKSVRLEEAKDDKGNNVVLCIGMVRPHGAMGHVLKDAFANPDCNAAFSIRCLSQPIMWRGSPAKDIKTILTWDMVNEPGMAVATKYNTPTMESFGDHLEVTPEMLMQAEQNSMYAFENAGTTLMDTTMIRSSLGWQKVELLSDRSATNW